MSKLGPLKSSLLMSAVALSVLSSSANAVSEDVVQAYWSHISNNKVNLDPKTLEILKSLNDAQWRILQATEESLLNASEYTKKGYYIESRANLITTLANMSPLKWYDFKSKVQLLKPEAWLKSNYLDTIPEWGAAIQEFESLYTKICDRSELMKGIMIWLPMIPDRTTRIKFMNEIRTCRHLK